MYYGKLYGKLVGKYFELDETTHDLEIIKRERQGLIKLVEKLETFPDDVTGRRVKLGDTVRGFGFLNCNGGYKIDLATVVKVTLDKEGVLHFGSLSAQSFPRFEILNKK